MYVSGNSFDVVIVAGGDGWSGCESEGFGCTVQDTLHRSLTYILRVLGVVAGVKAGLMMLGGTPPQRAAGAADAADGLARDDAEYARARARELGRERGTEAAAQGAA